MGHTGTGSSNDCRTAGANAPADRITELEQQLAAAKAALEHANQRWCDTVPGYFVCEKCRQVCLEAVGKYEGLCEECFDEQCEMSDGMGQVNVNEFLKKNQQLRQQLAAAEADVKKLNERLLQIHTAAGEAIVGAPSPIDAFRMLKEQCIHWQGLAYTGMRVIDAIIGGCTTEESCTIRAEGAVRILGENQRAFTRMVQQCDEANLDRTKLRQCIDKYRNLAISFGAPMDYITEIDSERL